MILTDIHLVGFRQPAGITAQSFQVSESQILTARDNFKKFLFYGFLAILYGIDDEDRFIELLPSAKVYTGRLVFQFDAYTLHIERDFGTNIVALVSLGRRKNKSVFQGKDFVGQEERPYLNILESLFTVRNKKLITGICYSMLEKQHTTFGDILDRVYLILRPKFKESLILSLISASKGILEKAKSEISKNGFGYELDILRFKFDLIKNFQKVLQSIENLKRDIEQFHLFEKIIEHQNPTSSQLYESLKQRFPLLHQLDAEQVKEDIKDVIFLKNEYNTITNQLNRLKDQKADLETQLNQKLLVYADLPDTFIQDFRTLQDYSTELASCRNEYDKLSTSLYNLKDDLNRSKKSQLIFTISLACIILAGGAFLFSDKIIYVIATALLVIGGVFFAYFEQKRELAVQINSKQQKQAELEIRSKNLENHINILRQESFLLDDVDFVDVHIKRFKKFKQIKAKIKFLDSEILKIRRELDHDKYKFKLKQLERRYSKLLDLNRPDLGSYLDQFENAQDEARKGPSEKELSVLFSPITNTVKIYERLIVELNSIKITIDKYLDFQDLENHLDVYTSQIDRSIKHLIQQQTQSTTIK